MTVEISTEKKFCKKCGADIRPHALFCYGCGSSVATDRVDATPISDAALKRGAEFKRKGGDQAAENGERLFANEPIAKPVLENIAEPINKPSKDLSKEKNQEIKVEKAKVENGKMAVKRETVLKTAASARKRTKPSRRKMVEVVWEQPPNAVNIWFLVTAIVLTLLAIGALLAMLYLH